MEIDDNVSSSQQFDHMMPIFKRTDDSKTQEIQEPNLNACNSIKTFIPSS